VLKAAADDFGWSTWKSKPNHGIGVGCGEEKGSVVATCAEVQVDADSGLISVVRVSVAFECGTIINPAHLENQIVGSVIQGLGGAMFESISFRDGKILNPTFSAYRVPRFSDVPKISVVTLNRMDRAPAGAGETPIIGIAPAIRNAILNVTGKPIYTLPLQRDTSEYRSRICLSYDTASNSDLTVLSNDQGLKTKIRFRTFMPARLQRRPMRSIFGWFLVLTTFSLAAQPKIGVTLSGGGAKGLAHIGILEAIDSAGLRVDCITGTSMGSIVG
jgi:hypothetical protein